MTSCPLEYNECCTFVDWLELKGLKFSHVPHETWTSSLGVKAKNKRLGVRKGVPDYIIITSQGLLFVEMKRQKGSKISQSQREWIKELQALDGIEARICKGAEEAIEFVTEFL